MKCVYWSSWKGNQNNGTEQILKAVIQENSPELWAMNTRVKEHTVSWEKTDPDSQRQDVSYKSYWTSRVRKEHFGAKGSHVFIMGKPSCWPQTSEPHPTPDDTSNLTRPALKVKVRRRRRREAPLRDPDDSVRFSCYSRQSGQVCWCGKG